MRNRNAYLTSAALSCLAALFAMAQDPQNSPLPKPAEIGQFFLLQDAKLIPLQEENDIYASATFTYDISVKIKGPESKVVIDSIGNTQFLVRLPDKSIGSYALYSLTKEKDKRTMRIGEIKRKILFTAVEYADSCFQLTTKARLLPGQYAFFYSAPKGIDHFYSFGVK